MHVKNFTRATLYGNLQVKGRRLEWAPWSSTGLYSYRKNPSVWTVWGTVGTGLSSWFVSSKFESFQFFFMRLQIPELLLCPMQYLGMSDFWMDASTSKWNRNSEHWRDIKPGSGLRVLLYETDLAECKPSHESIWILWRKELLQDAVEDCRRRHDVADSKGCRGNMEVPKQIGPAWAQGQVIGVTLPCPLWIPHAGT